MIKYLGSKRRLVPVLGEILGAAHARTALDLFTGTTRVAQELKRRSVRVTAVDTARYSEVFAQCYIAIDKGSLDQSEIEDALRCLDALPGKAGYFTETFCQKSRFFQPHNGERVDAIREAIEDDYAESAMYPILLTSLIEAADRVDSTTGLQMAFIKEWAPRSYNHLKLRLPELLDGHGTAVRGDACEFAGSLGSFDIAYLDPPYNQHRYFTNYHIWETLVAMDAPEHYGVACKRIDARDELTKSAFNSKSKMPGALSQVIRDVDSRLLVLSYNNESWMGLKELREVCAERGAVEVLAFDSKRYVGAQIGVFNPQGKRVGEVSHLRNLEYVLVAGDRAEVRRLTSPYEDQRRAAS